MGRTFGQKTEAHSECGVTETQARRKGGPRSGGQEMDGSTSADWHIGQEANSIHSYAMIA